MKKDNQILHLYQPFEQVLIEAREAIIKNGFLLLHEIDTQAVLAKPSIATEPLRQLLFFHPVYMQEILQQAPEAVIEAPLKLVMRSISERKTTLHCFHPFVHLFL